jgi:hypothetical protein
MPEKFNYQLTNILKRKQLIYCIKKVETSLALVAHACNPSYSGGSCSKPAPGK